jgi:hypothetical protein
MASKYPRVFALPEGLRPLIAHEAWCKVPVMVRQQGVFRVLETLLGARGGPNASAPALVSEAELEEARLATSAATKEAYGAHLLTCLRRLKLATAPDPSLLTEHAAAAAAAAALKPKRPKATTGPGESERKRARGGGVHAAPASPPSATPPLPRQDSDGGSDAWSGPPGAPAASRCPVCGRAADAAGGEETMAWGGDRWHQQCVDRLDATLRELAADTVV